MHEYHVFLNTWAAKSSPILLTTIDPVIDCSKFLIVPDVPMTNIVNPSDKEQLTHDKL